MFSDTKNLKLCKEEKIELDLYKGIYLHPSDSDVETEDDRGVHFMNVKCDFKHGILPNDFLNLTFEKEPLVRLGRLVEKAFAGDSPAQEVVKYVYHETAREILKEVSEKSGNVSLYFLAVGCPEGAGLFGGISTASDVILILDDFYQGFKANVSGNAKKGEEHFKQATKSGTIILFALGIKQGTKRLRTIINKKIVIIVGKNKQYYALGRRGAIKEKEALRKLMIKDFANGYFGTEIASAIFEEMIDKSLNKLYKYLGEKEQEDEKAEKKEE